MNRTDTLTVVKWRTDSIHVRDSVATFIKGDTLIVDRWHTLYRERFITDTVLSIRTDSVSVSVPYPVETIREVCRLRWWQTALMWTGAVALLASAAWIAVKLKLK